jgi:predicted TIM-barrel fold metal-dependent hydrolase
MMQGKVALEEHVVLSSLSAPGAVGSPGDSFEPTYFEHVRQRLADSSLRIEDMDRSGIQTMVLSLSQPGVQGMFERDRAVDTARRLNDELAEVVARHPRRFAAFAALPLQDPATAGTELERAVRELGFKGALVNGYSNIGDAQTAQYLDEPPVWEFWERVAALAVPIYLHPRDPLVGQRRIYEGYPALLGSAWGFGVETATHALRLIMSGLFDRFPGLVVVLGHLAEGLPFLLPRVEHRLRHAREDLRGRQTRPLMSYLRDNFFITTSGAFRTAALLDTLLEVGAERVLFSVDYPYETMREQTEWFEALPISDADREKIGAANARQLLRLD